MTNKVIVRKSKLPVYQGTLWIIICSSIPKAIEHVEDLVNDRIHEDDRSSTQAYAYSYTESNGNRHFMIFLKPSAKPGEIAHEAKHLVNQVFHWYEVKLSLTNDESECYYLERVVDKLHAAINFYKKVTKNLTRKKKSLPLSHEKFIDQNSPADFSHKT